MKRILFYLMILAACPVAAQEPDSLEEKERWFTEYMNIILYEKFLFDKPGPEFQLLEDSSGYEYLDKKATIKFMVFPGAFDTVATRFTKRERNADVILIDTASFTKPRTGFILIEEHIPPPDQASENFMMFIAIFPFSKNISVGVTGVYPKSMDSLYRKKFRDAAFSLQQVQQ